MLSVYKFGGQSETQSSAWLKRGLHGVASLSQTLEALQVPGRNVELTLGGMEHIPTSFKQGGGVVRYTI